MKREFLRELGIDGDALNAIMAENGKDIEKAKKDYDTILETVKTLETEISEKENAFKNLEILEKEKETLSAKVTDLENKNTALKRENEIDTKLFQAKAKNIKAVKALLCEEEDLEEQIKTLKESSETGFLFEQEINILQTTGITPVSTSTIPITNTNLTFVDRIANALNKGD